MVAQTVLTQSLESVEALFFIVPTNNSLATILNALSSGNAKGSGVGTWNAWGAAISALVLGEVLPGL